MARVKVFWLPAQCNSFRCSSKWAGTVERTGYSIWTIARVRHLTVVAARDLDQVVRGPVHQSSEGWSKLVFPVEDDIMSVLFETPSGFAIFHCCASLIEGKDVLEGLWVKFTDNFDAYRLVWLKQFKTFEDKSSAITQNGVNERLSKMIMKFHFPWSKLAVAKPEYKEIVELYLNISCVHGPAVMELMWGIQNCMQLLVPMEKQKLTEADRLPISEGLHALLSRYGCVVKPEMVSEEIVNVASALFWCESVEKENETPLRSLGCLINRVSGINCDSWSLLTIATAIQVIWCPEEIAGPCEEFSAKKISRLFEDRDTYDAYLDKYECVRTSVVMIKAHDVRTRSEKRLKFLVEQAKASEA